MQAAEAWILGSQSIENGERFEMPIAIGTRTFNRTVPVNAATNDS